jgi:hypothetical protein
MIVAGFFESSSKNDMNNICFMNDYLMTVLPSKPSSISVLKTR